MDHRPYGVKGNHSKGLGLQKPTDFRRRAYPRLLLEEKLSPQVTDEVYLTPPRKATSSVTAYAVPPSPQGEGFGAVQACDLCAKHKSPTGDGSSPLRCYKEPPKSMRSGKRNLSPPQGAREQSGEARRGMTQGHVAPPMTEQ